MNPFKQKLIDLGACADALDWVGDRTLEQAWAECDNFGWLDWVVCRLDLPKTEFVNLACRAARSVLHLILEGEDRPRLAIEAAEKWLAEPTQENRHAAYSAYAATYAASAASAAVYAAYDAYAAYAIYAATGPASPCDKFREFYPVELVKRGLGL